MLAREPSEHLRRAVRYMMLFLQDKRSQLELRQITSHLKDQPHDMFSHCDIRSDNLAWNHQTGRVVLVDWNWANFVPRNFGSTEFLIDMAVRGLDISAHKNLLNRELLAGVIGFYLGRCARPAGETGEDLRNFRLRTAAIALDLLRQ